MTALSDQEPDARDMARLAAGHDPALNDLMERHGEKLFHHLVPILAQRGGRPDLAQETFVRVFTKIARSSIRTKNFPPGSFARIASNLVRDRYRWRSRHPQTSLDAEYDQSNSNLKDILPSAEPTPTKPAGCRESRRRPSRRGGSARGLAPTSHPGRL